MKKVLLASTVLAMTATVAAAEVTVSGSARMGVAYNSEAPNEFGFTSRARVNFSMSGETDSGLSFGASFAAHDSDEANNGTGGDVNGAGSMSAGSVFISGAFGKLTMGDVSGAAETVVGDLAGVGLTGLGDLNENNYLSNDGTGRAAATYTYSTGGLTFALSADNPQFDTVIVGGAQVAGTRDVSSVYSVGAKYQVDAYSFALGYETMDLATSATTSASIDHIIIGGEATFSGVTLKATYGEVDSNAAGYAFLGEALTGSTVVGATDVKQFGVSASYTMDALTVAAYHRQVDFGTPGKFKFTGIGAEYGLGGGATVAGGLVDVSAPAGFQDSTLADFGVKFSF